MMTDKKTNSLQPIDNKTEKADDYNMTRLFSRLKTAGLIALFFSFLICVFGPYELYYTNKEEFWFRASDLIPVVAFAFLVSFLIVVLFLAVWRGAAYDYFAAFAFAGTLNLYIQGNFMFVNYGTLDGAAIAWEEFYLWGIFNTIIWITVFVAFLLLMKKKRILCYKIIRVCSVILILVLAVTLGTLIVSDRFDSKEMDSDGSYYWSNKGMFEASKENNIIIFVLDSFESTYFKELLLQKPEYGNKFKDFVYYPDTAGNSARTKLAMPYILTGKSYTENISYYDYLKNAYRSSPLYDELEKNNYDTRIYTDPMYAVPEQAGRIANLINEVPKVGSFIRLGKTTYKSVAFKYMPHILKKYFWFYTDEFNRAMDDSYMYVTNDSQFYKNLKANPLTISSKNIFRIYHLQGPHSPYLMNEFAETIPDQETDRTRQAEGCLYILMEYLNQLKALEVYDNSTIFVMADHGETLAQNPLLLIKKQNTHNSNMEISDAQISFSNLHPTLLALLSDDYEWLGDTIDQVQPGENKHRVFYLDKTESMETIIEEYQITGKADNMENMKLIRELRPMSNWSKTYELGTVLTFSQSEVARPYMKEGFARSDGDFTWSLGERSIFEFEFLSLPQECNLRVDVKLKDRVKDSVESTVYANDQLIGEMLVESNNMSFIIPANYVQNGSLVLRLDYGNADSPKNITGSRDDRVLALAFEELCISIEE